MEIIRVCKVCKVDKVVGNLFQKQMLIWKEGILNFIKIHFEDDRICLLWEMEEVKWLVKLVSQVECRTQVKIQTLIQIESQRLKYH